MPRMGPTAFPRLSKSNSARTLLDRQSFSGPEEIAELLKLVERITIGKAKTEDRAALALLRMQTRTHHETALQAFAAAKKKEAR